MRGSKILHKAELGLTLEKMFEQYCEVYVGPNSRIPLVRILSRGSVKRCPLLKDRKCSVHESKPVVCRLYPLGRTLLVDYANTIQKKYRKKLSIRTKHLLRESGWKTILLPLRE